MQDLVITLIQSDLKWEDKRANLGKLSMFIKNIAGETDLIVLPEMFNTAFSMKPELFAEPLQGDTFEWMLEHSQYKKAAIAGSFMVKENGHFFNRFMVVFPDGSHKHYDKRHLFRMGNEQLHYQAGQNPLIFEIHGWKIKPQICYDLRFPVFAKNNYIGGKYDYDLLLYVANWPAVRNKVWQSLLLARALENQCFVAGVNRVGIDGNGLEHLGNSCLLNARGEELIAAQADTQFVQTTSLNYADLEDFRNKFTVGLDWDRFDIIS